MDVFDQPFLKSPQTQGVWGTQTFHVWCIENLRFSKALEIYDFGAGEITFPTTQKILDFRAVDLKIKLVSKLKKKTVSIRID